MVGRQALPFGMVFRVLNENKKLTLSCQHLLYQIIWTQTSSKSVTRIDDSICQSQPSIFEPLFITGLNELVTNWQTNQKPRISTIHGYGFSGYSKNNHLMQNSWRFCWWLVFGLDLLIEVDGSCRYLWFKRRHSQNLPGFKQGKPTKIDITFSCLTTKSLKTLPPKQKHCDELQIV